jgi:restriction system protein
MATIWGIHNNEHSLDLVGGRFISIGWEELGDLTDGVADKDELKARLAKTYPTAKPGAIPVWAGVLWKFMEEMSIGDFIISPNKADRTINFGVVEGPFYVESGVELHPNRRRVRWVRTGIPRDDFSKSALNEIGSAVTLFRVTRHAQEFLPYFSSAAPPIEPVVSDEEAEVELVEVEPSAERAENYAQDFVISILKALEPYRFEHFVGALLRAMGYRTTVTQKSGDGGVDVIANRDPLGIEPPIIKVQCKRTTSTIGGPVVQQLAGALAHGGSELGLFVTLGSYAPDALHMERTRQDLRLINGSKLVELVFEHYAALESEWKRLLPLRPVYAVDRNVTEA